MSRLTEIANKYDADKGTTFHDKHGYTFVYERYICEIVPCRLLEIGIQHGKSIRMWKEYNPRMELFAMDQADCSEFFDVTLCEKVFVLDQMDKVGQIEMGKEIAPLDYVIDDGAHHMPHHHTSLSALFGSVASGGLYFIEDLHTCKDFPSETRTTDLLKKWMNTGHFISPFLDIAENIFISENIASIEFFNNDKLVKIVKK